MNTQLISQMLVAFVKGDIQLSQFEDSLEKEIMLKELAPFSNANRELSQDELLDLSQKLQSSQFEEQVKILTDLLDSGVKITPELLQVLAPYSDLLKIVRESNKTI